MSFAETVALGALAGLTIYLGLPLGRLQLVGSRTRVALAMFSVGILAFVGNLAHLGRLPRTRPIVPGELAVSD